MRKIVCFMILCFMAACEDFDGRVDDLEDRVGRLEELCTQMNRDIVSMQEIVSALEDNDFVTDTQPILDNGRIVGYEIIFEKAGKIAVYLGKDGENGSNPEIGVARDSDGEYYWTMNGKFMEDADGNRIPVSGRDGEKGNVPKVKLFEGIWYVSYDNGASWENYGPAGEGSGSAFTDIVFGEEAVVLTLKDGTELTLPRSKRPAIVFDADEQTHVFPGEAVRIGFTLENVSEKRRLIAESNGYYKVELCEEDARSGSLVVTCPEAYEDGYINVILTDNGYSVVRVINFFEGCLSFSDGSEYYVSPKGGQVRIPMEVNFKYEVRISEEAGSWLSIPATRGGAMRNETVNVSVAANNTGATRSGSVLIYGGKASGEPYKVVTIHQMLDDADLDKAMIFVVEANEQNEFRGYLPLGGKVDCRVDWGDGTVEEVKGSLDGYVSHAYKTDRTTRYVVSVLGTVTALDSSNMTDANGNPRFSITEVLQWGDTGLESMSNAFRNNSLLTRVRQGGGKGFRNLSNVYAAFHSCSSLESLPADLFAGCSRIDSFDSTFYGCNSLQEIPEGLFDECPEAANFFAAFYDCVALKRIPENLFALNGKATGFEYTFYGCTGLEEIPADLFARNVKATSFGAVFCKCSGLESIPVSLFSRCPEADSFSWSFGYCSSLKTVPAGMFDNNSKATNFECVFGYCSSLKTVPAGLFAKCTMAQNFKYLFYECESLESLPADLFAGCAGVKSFRSAFYHCQTLKTLPAGLFDGCPEVEDFGYLCWTCANLKSLPEGLFDKCTRATTFQAAFNRCASLVSIPAGLFRNCSAVTNYSWVFSDCSKLASVPSDLFGESAATDFSYLFAYCAQLTDIPVGLFDGCRKAENFQNTFNGCSAFAGESPYTEIGGRKYHLYERCELLEEFVKPSGSGCFMNCNKMKDANEVPVEWL